MGEMGQTADGSGDTQMVNGGQNGPETSTVVVGDAQRFQSGQQSGEIHGRLLSVFGLQRSVNQFITSISTVVFFSFI